MTEDDVFKPLSGVAGPVEMVAVPPASRLASAPKQVLRRVVGRLRAARIRRSHRGRIEWAAPVAGDRAVAWRAWLLKGRVDYERSASAPVELLRTDHGFEPINGIRVGAGGTLRQMGRIGGEDAVARFGVVGTSSDPGRHYAALTRFRIPSVPRPLGTGIVEDVRWTVEEMVDGRPPRALTPRLIDEIDRFLVSLPRPDGAVRVIGEAANELASRALGDFDPARHRERLDALIDLPAVVSHGDMWLGNLLVRDDDLTGVLDWDSWASHGVPALDIIHLFADEARRRRRTSYGAVIRQRFWEEAEASRAIQGHLRRRGIDAAVSLPMLAEAWWLTTVAGSVARVPRLATSGRWLDENVIGPSEWFLAQPI